MSKKEMRTKAKVLAKEYGYLQYMIERYLMLWGEDETIQFLKACEKPIRQSIRVNTLKSTNDFVLDRLRKKSVVIEEIPWLENGFFTDFQGSSPGALLEHMLGFYYVQGVPSMTAVRVLNPQPGETVLDLAAAPAQ